MPKALTKIVDLQSKDDEQLQCMDAGHSWARLGYFHWNGRNGICRRWYCTSCTSEKDEYFVRSHARGQWKLMDRRYSYAEGYLKKGTGRVFKQDIHNEVIRRVISNNEFLPDEAWDTPAPQLARL